MSDKPNIDFLVAKELTLPIEAVGNARREWNHNQIMREVFKQKFGAQIRERQQALESIQPEMLKAKQAEITALKLAISIVTTIDT